MVPNLFLPLLDGRRNIRCAISAKNVGRSFGGSKEDAKRCLCRRRHPRPEFTQGTQVHHVRVFVVLYDHILHFCSAAKHVSTTCSSLTIKQALIDSSGLFGKIVASLQAFLEFFGGQGVKAVVFGDQCSEKRGRDCWRAQPVALLRRHVCHVLERLEPSDTSEIAIVVAGHRFSCIGSRRAGGLSMTFTRKSNFSLHNYFNSFLLSLSSFNYQ